jgi:hypothetical protein
MADPRIAYITQRARQLGLDPEAVLAIAGHEGLSGRIGDGGHAFGPFQENDAGGVLTGKLGGMTPTQKNAWAWSHQGIDSALGQIAGVARGLKGRAAIEAIATKFERPQNPGAEISDAMAHYGHYGAGAGSAPVGAQEGLSAPSAVNAGGSLSRQQLAQLVFSQGGVDFNSNQVQAPNLMALTEARAHQSAGGAGTPVAPPRAMPSSITPGGVTGGTTFVGDTSGVNSGFLAKLSHAAKAAGVTQIKVTSGFRDPSHNAAVGGVQNSNHTTGHALDGEAFIPGRGWVPLGQALLPIAGKFGLRSGDVPGFFNGGTDPVHVDDGWNQGH